MEALIEEMLDGQIMLSEAISEFEKLYIQKALARYDDHLSRTADALGIHRNTLSKRVAGYQNQPRSPKRLIARRNGNGGGSGGGK
jgi:transcriptional regulator with PAS, ATPase and Fis domain